MHTKGRKRPHRHNGQDVASSCVTSTSTDSASGGSRASHVRKGFQPPTVQEVTEYCQANQLPNDAQRFVDFYTARGWRMSKGLPMRDWHAAVNDWKPDMGCTQRQGNGAPMGKVVSEQCYDQRTYTNSEDAMDELMAKWQGAQAAQDGASTVASD